MALKGLGNVIGNIKKIFERRRVATYALALEYAAMAINYFQEQQSGEAYWTNRSGQARDRMFTGATLTTDVVTWFISHSVQYGVYLELANNGDNESLRKVINHFLPQFKKDLDRIWGKAA